MANGYDKYLEYQYQQTGGFFTKLFKLIAVADGENNRRLALGFPEEVDAVNIWQSEGPEALQTKVTPDHPLLPRFREEYGLEAADGS